MHGHKDSKIEMLRALPLFKGCSEKELEQVSVLVDSVSYEAGHVAIREGVPLGLECLIIVEGEMAVSHDGEHVATLGRGDVVGEMSLLEPVPRSATVTALTPVSAVVMDPRGFNSLLDDVPSVAETIVGIAKARHQ